MQAADVARKQGDIELLARAAAGLRGYGEMGANPEPETLALLEEALVAVGEDHAASRSRVLSRLAGTAPYARRMAERRRLSAEAYDLARASGDRQAISDALAARYWATLGPDYVTERRQVSDEALRLGREWGDPRLRILGHEAAIGAHLVLGDMAAAGREVDRYGELASEIRQPLFLCLANLFRGSYATNLGRFEEAQRFFDTALACGRGTVVYAEILYAGTVYWLRNMRRESPSFDDVGPLLDQIYTEEDVNLRMLVRVGSAIACLNGGDLEGARREYEEIVGIGIRGLERDESWLLCMGVIADLALEFQDAQHASIVYELLAPYEELMLVHDLIRVFGGSVSQALGIAAAAAGELDTGEAHLERAIERETRQGLLPALCNSQGALARLLVARGRRGDRARARELVERSEAGSRAIGTLRASDHARAAADALERDT
jgi:tetratricopeptide (TPR) repeat protein